MKDNRVSLAAKNYANALIELSRPDNSFDEIKTQLSQVLETINSAPDLKLVLENSSVSVKNKKEIIEDVFKTRIDDRILNLLKILADKKRIQELEGIFLAYCEIADSFEKRKNVEIISSVELKQDIKEKIINKLEQKLNSNVVPSWSVDESLIAGLKFRFGDVVVDTSVRAKLESLSKHILR